MDSNNQKSEKVKKAKRQRQPAGKVFKNNWFVLKYIFKACPLYLPLICLCSIIGTVIFFFEYTYGVMLITDAIQYGKPFEEVIKYIILIFAFGGGWYLFTAFVWGTFNNILIEKLERYIKKDIFNKAKTIDLECYDNPTYYNDYIWTLNNIIPEVRRAGDIYKSIVGAIVQLAMAGYMFATFNKMGLIFASVSTITSLIIAFKQKRIAYDLGQDNALPVRKRNYVARLFYLNDYAKDLRLYDIKDNFQGQYDEANESIIKNTKKYSKKQIMFNMIKYFTGNFLIDTLYFSYLIYIAVANNALSYGAIFALLRVSRGLFSSGITTIVNAFPAFAGTSLYIEKFRKFMSEENKVKNSGTLLLKNEPCEIKFVDVSFSYDEGKTYVLKNINLSIKPKEKIAIVGFNGAGKTTLTKLLMRFYEPTSGRIEIDGRDIKEYKLESLRSGIGVLFQDFQVLAASIKENVAMDTVYDVEKVQQSLERSGFGDKLKSLPKGLDTIITKEFDNDGVMFSGGENQKIAMARLLYKDCAFAILDEPSSALDPKAEYNVNSLMLEEAKSKTVIFISHRLSTAKIADKIYFFENGEITEHGTHNDLMANKKRYHELYELQAQKYKLAV